MTLAALLDQLAPDLIERACAGDRAAMEELVSTMQRPFYNLAPRMLSDRSLAEDAAQECLLRVVTHLSEWKGEARFATWATRIAVYATLDFRSGMARNTRYGFGEFAERLAQGFDEDASDRPQDALLVKQAKTLCNRALLQCLDGDHRTAFVLGDILEFDATDAASILGIEAAAHWKRLSRARSALTDALRQNCSVHTPALRCACHRKVGEAEKKALTFPVLSDIGNRVASQYGLVVRFSAVMQKVQAAFDVPLPRFNGDKSWEVPTPAVFVVDRAGVVRFASANADWTKRVEPSAIVRALDSIPAA